MPGTHRDKPYKLDTGYLVGLQPTRIATLPISVQTMAAACRESSGPEPGDDQYVLIESTVTYSSALSRNKHVAEWQVYADQGKKHTVRDLSQANY